MGAVTGLLGLGANNGQITDPTNQGQINAAYNTAQNAQGSQQSLLNALQGQNGIQNQSQVYQQLQGVANGTGPNPAQAMLNQATGANVSNQAALMAGQRGAGSNVGLLARQAGQQGANLQQQAVGQGATMQANQSLNAIGAAGNLATNQVGNQIGATTANTQAAQSEQNILNNANAGVNTINAGLQAGVTGGLMGGAGSAIGALLANGGTVHKYAGGGGVQPGNLTNFLNGWTGSQSVAPAGIDNSALVKGGQAIGNGAAAAINAPPSYNPNLGAQFSNAGNDSNNGVQFGGLTGSQTPSSFGGLGMDKTFAKGGNVGTKLKSGGHVPGTPKVPGNSYSNDTVKALLSPGEVVIPNSVMQSQDPVRGAAQFVQAQLAKKRMR